MHGTILHARQGLCILAVVAMLTGVFCGFAFAEAYSLLGPIDTESKYDLTIYDDTDWVAMPWYSAMAEAFEKMFPNIDVKTIGVSCAQMERKLLTDVAGGNPPDLPRSMYRLGALAERGMFMDLTEVVEHWPRRLDFSAASLALGKHRGRQYGIPEGQFILQQVFYNKDHFKEAGLPLVEPTAVVDWNEHEQLLNKLQSAFGQRKGYYPTCVTTTWDKNGFSFILYQNGGSWWSEDYETPTWTSPEAIEAFKWFVSIYRDGLSPRPAPGTAGFKQKEKLFWEERISVMIEAMHEPRAFPANAPNLVGEDEWGTYTLTAPGKDPVEFSWDWSHVITKNAPHPAAAWAWIELCCTNWGVKKIMRDAKYFPTIKGIAEDLQKEGVYSRQIAEWYNSVEPYVLMRDDAILNHKYPETEEIIQAMCEKMMYGVKDIKTLAEEAKKEALELIRGKK